MGDPLDDYIRGCFKDGFDEDEVRARLADAGYEPGDIEAAFGRVLEGPSAAPAPARAEGPERRRPAALPVGRSVLPAALFLILVGLILLAAVYYYLFVMEMDATDDPDSFKARFSDCRPARASMVAADGTRSVVRVLGPEGGRCAIEVSVTGYQGADGPAREAAAALEGRSMRCRVLALPGTLDEVAAGENACAGDLVDALRAAGRLGEGAKV